ncbi:MAG: antitoxin family protein [Phycisphaerales bacterium]|nr:antitoxin family protein [Phycisphaerales bacterium]
MTQYVEAIFTGGVLKPLEALQLPERQRVRLAIEPIDGSPADDRAAAMNRLLDSLSNSTFSHGGPYPSRDELHER